MNMARHDFSRQCKKAICRPSCEGSAGVSGYHTENRTIDGTRDMH